MRTGMETVSTLLGCRRHSSRLASSSSRRATFSSWTWAISRGLTMDHDLWMGPEDAYGSGAGRDRHGGGGPDPGRSPAAASSWTCAASGRGRGAVEVVEERERAEGVDDAAGGEQRRDLRAREDARQDALGRIELEAVRAAAAERREGVHPVVADAVDRVEARQRHQAAAEAPGLLAQLAERGLLGRLAGGQTPGRDLPAGAPVGMAELADQHQVAVLEHGDDHGGGRYLEDVVLAEAAVG